MASEKLIEGKPYSLMLGKYGTYFAYETGINCQSLTNQQVLDLLNDKYNAVEENAKDFQAEIVKLESTIKKLEEERDHFMEATNRNAENTETVANANKFFALKAAKLQRKYEYQIPFPDCIKEPEGVCRNQIATGLTLVRDKNACANCVNRRLETILKNGQ